MRVLTLASQKGGSGKTTLSGHLAVQAQRAGAGPVVLIDIDPQGSLADWWNEREAEYPTFAQTTVARLANDLQVMRQQGFKNDMGGDELSNVVPISPASDDADDAPVLTLAKKIAAPANTTAVRKSALKQGKPAAFTLCLDAERHLKLRLASTIKGQSAQQIVTDALDSLLNEIKELDALDAQMPQH